MNASELRELAAKEKRYADAFAANGRPMQAQLCNDRAEKLEAQAKQTERRERIQWHD